MPRRGFLARLLVFLAPLCCLAAGAQADDAPLMRLVQRPEDQALIVNLTLNHISIGDNMVVYPGKNRLLVPLNGVMAALEIAITADPETGKASGFFINEKRRFELDLATATATFDGKTFTLPADKVERQATDIYVDTSLLTEWFSIRLRLDTEDLSLVVFSVELLPVQERLERERRRSGVYHPGAPGEYQIIEPPARWVDWPFVDTYLQYQTSRTGGPVQQQGQFTVEATDMVGGLDLDMAANGTIPNEDNVDSLRATLGRRDPRGGLLGPIDAREFALGDVSSPTLPLVSDSFAGRGAMVSTFELHRLSDLQRVTLRGDLPAGWQVELYRGADLMDFQVSSGDGRYDFENVPTIVGLNAFKLVFYGPEGQRREEDRPIYVSAATVSEGETGFRLLANQQNTGLFGNFPSNQPALTPFTRFDSVAQNQQVQPSFNNGAWRFTAEADHGLSATTALTGAVSSMPVGSATEQYAQAGLRASWFGALSTLNLATSSQGGVAYGVGSQGQFGLLSWLLSYDGYDHFLSERSFDVDLDQPLSSSSTARLNGVLPVYRLGSLPFATSATYNVARDGAWELQLDGRVTSFISRFSLSAETQANLRTALPTQTQEVFRIGTQFGKVGLRGEVIYDLTPEAELSAGQVTADFAVAPNLSLRLGVTQLQTPPQETQFTTGASVLLTNFAVGTDINVSTRGDFSVLLKLHFGFGVEPRSDSPIFRNETFARSGAISPLVFLDRNGDGKFGPGDELLPNVSFRGEGSPFHNKTDETGTALITGLEPYQETPVAIDVQSLEDPYWKVPDQKIAVLPRPGSVVQIDFPVYETGEIDGTVAVERGAQHVPLPGIRLQVVDADGKVVGQSLSGYDGSFFLQGVRLGRYTLRADPSQLAMLHLGPAEAQSLELSHDKPAVSAGTINLVRAGTPVDGAATKRASTPASVDSPS